MKGKVLINLFLVALVLGLGLWMTTKPGNEGGPATRLSTLQPDGVNVIRVMREGIPEIVLERAGKRWKQTAPFAARTDGSQAGRLLELLAAQSQTSFPAENLARFGLDKPFARVIVGTQEFAFGTQNTLTQEQYVLVGDRVHLVPPVFAYGLPTRADSLATHMLLAEEDVPVRLELPGVTLAQKDGKWTRSTDTTEKSSQDDLTRWAEEWRFASSLATQPIDADPKGEPVRIALRDGRTIDLVIVSRTPELVIARKDEKLRFVFAADKAASLFAPPKTEP